MKKPAISSPLWSGPTVAEILDANKGVGPGFDWARIALSVLVIFSHSFHTSYGYANIAAGERDPIGGAFGPVIISILAMFFSLSGFLVAGSAFRLRDVRAFIAFRVLRIVPALLVEVTLCAIILGALVTTLPLDQYFSDPRVYSYFGNVVGWVHFVLPGVFEDNPLKGIVNVNLWTLHPELYCYGIMAVIMLIGLVYSRFLMTLAWIGATLTLGIYNLVTSAFEPHGVFIGDVLVFFFFSGVVAYHWRERIRVSTPLFIAALISSYVLLLLPQTVFLSQFPLIYMIIWIGMQKFPRIEFLQRGDYSYGIYLYGYPVEQTLAHLFPAIRHWYLMFPTALMITFAIAWVSWHLIEKPALSLKRFVPKKKLAAPLIPVER